MAVHDRAFALPDPWNHSLLVQIDSPHVQHFIQKHVQCDCTVTRRFFRNEFGELFELVDGYPKHRAEIVEGIRSYLQSRLPESILWYRLRCGDGEYAFGSFLPSILFIAWHGDQTHLRLRTLYPHDAIFQLRTGEFPQRATDPDGFLMTLQKAVKATLDRLSHSPSLIKNGRLVRFQVDRDSFYPARRWGLDASGNFKIRIFRDFWNSVIAQEKLPSVYE